MNIKFNLIIPSAGKNTRMNTKKPKTLFKIKKKINLENLFKVFNKYTNQTYVCISNEKNSLKIYKKILNKNIFNKINFSTSTPGRGDGQAVYDTMVYFQDIKKRKYLIICWGDVYIRNSKTMENLINEAKKYLKKYDCIIPLYYTHKPYVNFIIDNYNKIKKIKFVRKGEFSSFGNSDYGIFILKSEITYSSLQKYFIIHKKNKEFNFLDFLLYAQNNLSYKILPLISKKYKIFSYNSKIEINKINKLNF